MPVRERPTAAFYTSRTAGRHHRQPRLFPFRITVCVTVVDAVAVSISIVNPPRVLERVVVIARIVALNLSIVILQSLFGVLYGLLFLRWVSSAFWISCSLALRATSRGSG